MDKQRGPGKPFQAGNKYGRGRPAGSRNKATLFLEALLAGDGEAIVRKTIDLAKAGNETALRLCMERLVPTCKERPVLLKLPADITSPEGIFAALSAVLSGLSRGEITPGETLSFAKMLEVCRNAIETQELARRLTALEKEVK